MIFEKKVRNYQVLKRKKLKSTYMYVYISIFEIKTKIFKHNLFENH